MPFRNDFVDNITCADLKATLARFASNLPVMPGIPPKKPVLRLIVYIYFHEYRKSFDFQSAKPT
jgi:hypothetical protein